LIAVFNRELKAYFSSVLAWVLVSVYLLIVGVIVAFSIEDFADISMMAMQGGRPANAMEQLVPPLLTTMGFLLLFFLPLLTMRLFAEERRSGTLDLLLTYPLTEAQILAGKFMASLTVVGMMLAFTLSGFVMLGRLTPLDWPALAIGYLGLLLLSAAFLAFGMWASSLTSSQLVASVLTYGGLLILWILSGIDRSGALKERFGDLSALAHLTNLTKGVLDTQDLVYFLALATLFLFLTARVLESRKWRG
jgi:ABC-2 type transport system permease protein